VEGAGVEMTERMAIVELNLDGLVGPTHNYAGLSAGNVASQRHGGMVAHPRQAALEGLAKMRALEDMGVPQMVLPPQERPDLGFLRQLGYQGSDSQVLERAHRDAPRLLAAATSASSMWAANAATVTPSGDAHDGRVHFTPANLLATLHRALEPHHTARALAQLFPGETFRVHDPLPASVPLGDEGAANHTRLVANAEAPGAHLFVYGRRGLAGGPQPRRFPARQTLEAGQALAHRHGLDPTRVVFAQQDPQVIDQGVFHNDVIAVGHRHVLLFHERAWIRTDEVVQRLAHLLDGALVPLCVRERDLSVDEAVGTYLFNSQIVSTRDGAMVLVAPAEVRRSDRARAVVDGLVAGDNPIARVLYVDVRQSMRNGGGPACLRLRVPLTPQELAAVHAPCRFDAALHTRLEAWVRRHYREQLAPDDLADPALVDECRAALDALTGILRLGGDFYPFQRVSAS
jgi:succinylarginine dihydrolase